MSHIYDVTIHKTAETVEIRDSLGRACTVYAEGLVAGEQDLVYDLIKALIENVDRDTLKQTYPCLDITELM